MPRTGLALLSLLAAAPARAETSIPQRSLELQLGAGALLRMPGYFAEGSDGAGGAINLALAPAWRSGRTLHGLRLAAQLGLPAGGERMTTGHDEQNAVGTSLRNIVTLGYQLQHRGFFFTVGTGAVINRFYDIDYEDEADGPGARTEALWEVLHVGVGLRQPVSRRLSLYLTAEAGTSIITWYRAAVHAGVVARF